MNPLTERLEDLRKEKKRVLWRAYAITEKPQMTIADRHDFNECMELVTEIDDYAARLQRQKEKWRTK